MKTVIIDKNTPFDIKSGKVKAYNATIPLKLVDMLIISNEVDISSKDIITLTNDNIALLFMNKNSTKFSLTLPLIAKNTDLKVMQYRAIYKNLEIAKQILHEKITTHQKSLELLGGEIDILEELSQVALAKSIDTLLGIEGAFARKYFGRYFSMFDKQVSKGFRSKRPPLDPINALLSFVYTIMYNTITSRLYFRGFDPSISYLHTPFRSHYALSSDILEMLRADINLFVAKLFTQKHLTPADFSKNNNGIYLTQSSRRALWIHLKPFLDTMNTPTNQAITKVRKLIVKPTL